MTTFADNRPRERADDAKLCSRKTRETGCTPPDTLRGCRREARPGSHGSKTHEKTTTKFRVTNRTRDPRQQPLEVIHLDGLSIEPPQVQVAAYDGKGIADFLLRHRLRENLFRFGGERQQSIEG